MWLNVVRKFSIVFAAVLFLAQRRKKTTLNVAPAAICVYTLADFLSLSRYYFGWLRLAVTVPIDVLLCSWYWK
jgi:hypothetical protein